MALFLGSVPLMIASDGEVHILAPESSVTLAPTHDDPRVTEIIRSKGWHCEVVSLGGTV